MPVQDTAEYQLLTPVRDVRVSKTTATKTGIGSSSVAKLRALRGSVQQDASQYQITAFTGPNDRASYFAEKQSQLDSIIFKVATDSADSIKELVFNKILDGSVSIDDNSDSVEKRQKVFGFIASESRQMIAA